MIERKIKELSIALEALSRIQGTEAYFGQVCSLLQTRIDEARKEVNPIHIVDESARNEDDIPF